MNHETETGNRRNRRLQLPLFFLLAFAFTWANWLPRAAAERGLFEAQLPEFVTLVAGYGPALAAIITAGLLEGRPALRHLFASLGRWRVGMRWYLALLIPLAIQLAALALHIATSSDSLRLQEASQLPFSGEGMSLWTQALLLFLIFVLGFDGLGEELGWRGFALPRLLEKQGPLISSLILGFFWAMWHVPYMLSAGSALGDKPFILFVLNALSQAILYTWLYLGTRGSTLLAILFHAVGNTSGTLIGATIPAAADPRVYIYGTALSWVVAIILIWRRVPSEQAAFAPE